LQPVEVVLDSGRIIRDRVPLETHMVQPRSMALKCVTSMNEAVFPRAHAECGSSHSLLECSS
jgi:hypothetical protein